MQTTGLFTVHKFDIYFEKYGEPIYLFPFGDIHRSSPNCDVDRWLEFLDWAKNKDRAYFLGMGDYDDLASSSERAILNNKALHDSTLVTLDKHYRKHTDDFYNEVKFMGDKVIGLIEGNHYQELQSGITTTQYLAEKMECKYLGVSSFIRLILHKSGRGTTTQSIDIWAHHGKGAARKVGGSLNKVEDMIVSANADIYLMGHDHKKSVGYVPTLELVETSGGIKLKAKKKLIARTGSFLKGFTPEKISYVADMALNPTDLGVIKIELTPRRIYKGKKEEYKIDIHTSI